MRSWSRVPQTLRCRLQVENYLLSLQAPTYSMTTVWRLVRQIELNGIYDNKDGGGGMSRIYFFLSGMRHGNLINVVLKELHRREVLAPSVSHVDGLALNDATAARRGNG